MKILIVYAHPYENSFNHAILENVLENLEKHSVDMIDLNQENFNPVMSQEDLFGAKDSKVIDPLVIKYQEKLLKADHVIFIFPIWFNSMPAILKGFIDKVFTKGFAYEPIKGKNSHKKLLYHLTGTVITTMGMPGIIYRIVYKNPIKQILIKGSLLFSGFKSVKWFNISNVQRLTTVKRNKKILSIKTYMNKLPL